MDPSAPGDDGDGTSRRAGGAGRLIAAGLGLYLLAILVARLLVAGGTAWVLLVFLAVLLLLILASRMGFLAALATVLLFSGAAAGFRWFILGGYGWPALLLLPVVVVTAAIAGRVLAAMRADRRSKGIPQGETVRAETDVDQQTGGQGR